MDHDKRLDEVWASKAHKVDWMELEKDIRNVLKDVKAHAIDPYEALHFIDGFIAAHTRRGSELGVK